MTPLRCHACQRRDNVSATFTQPEGRRGLFFAVRPKDGGAPAV